MYLLLILMIIVSLIAYYRVEIQINIGPMWDTYDFLSNALLFSGNGIGYSDLNRPPVLPFLTSIFFRLGYISETAIFAVDGFFMVVGAIGLYLLFKLRFNHMISFLGSLLFSTFPIIVLFSGAGLSDIPSVSLTIWAFYFMVMAIKKSSKYFYLAFPTIMIAFLTRYTAGLVLFPFLLYLLINKQVLKNQKDIFIGIFCSILVLIPVLFFFYNTFGNPFYSFQSFFSSGSANLGTAENYYYQPDLLYYLKHLISYIGPAGIVVILIILLGIVIYGFFGINEIKKGCKKIFSRIHMNKEFRIRILVFLILTLIFIFTFSNVNFVFSEVIFFFLCLVSYKLVEGLEIKYLEMNFLFLSWFMTFFIFHSIFTIKDDRYFVTMAPATAYFLILGFNEIFNRLKHKIKDKNLISTLLPLILIAIMLVSTINYIPGIINNNEPTKEKVEMSILASNWLKNYDPDYKNKIIYADYWSYFSWHLKMDVKPMLVYKDGKVYSYQLKDYRVDKLSNIGYNTELNENNADYYFSNRKGLNLTYYKPIKQFGFITLYQRI